MAKTIVITGVSQGLGHALTLELARLGHTVAGCGRNRSAIAELTARYASEGHSFAAVDVADEAQVAAWASAVVERHAAPDLLLNNAGVINETAPLWQVPPEQVSQLLDINIKGVISVIRHFLPAMQARGQGVIVNFSSGWGRSTAPGVAPYCASKWAIEGLSRALAQELPAGLAALPLNPGIINTAMLKTCFGSSAEDCQDPVSWAKTAAPYLLSLGPEHNGQPLSAP